MQFKQRQPTRLEGASHNTSRAPLAAAAAVAAASKQRMQSATSADLRKI